MNSKMPVKKDRNRAVQHKPWEGVQQSSPYNPAGDVALKQQTTMSRATAVADISPQIDQHTATRTAEIARTMACRIFTGIDDKLGIKLWDGMLLSTEKPHTPACTIVFHCPHAFANMVIGQSPLRLAEDYFAGKVDIEGDIHQVIVLRYHFQSLRLSLWDKTKLLWQALTIKLIETGHSSVKAIHWRKPLRQWFGLRPDRELNQSAIAFHYDVSNDFYRLWLDRRMVYSCAYFEDPGDSLDQAQANKLDQICRKLRLQAGETLLDVGCGWGSLMFWAVEHYGIRAHGITLSRQQYEHARFKIRERNLEDRITVEMRDYRDLNEPERYDKAVSVGMFEHVGLKNMPLYFATVHKQLKQGGLFLNHGITAHRGGWRKDVGSAFINKYVFPDGQLERISTVQQLIEDAGFEIHDVENLRPHYALTLREWVRRLQARHDDALRHVPESTYRIWLLYMTGSAERFEAGKLAVHQVLVSKRKTYSYPLPLTRRDLYH